MLLRRATEADIPDLRALYAETVHAQGGEWYSPDQVVAWAGWADEEGFDAFILEPHTVIVEFAGPEGAPTGDILGFGGVDATGHVASLYVRSDMSRKGVGTLILERLIELATEMGASGMHTVAGEFSRGLFARYGFKVDEVERLVRRGALFERYKMSRALETPQPVPPNQISHE